MDMYAAVVIYCYYLLLYDNSRARLLLCFHTPKVYRISLQSARCALPEPWYAVLYGVVMFLSVRCLYSGGRCCALLLLWAGVLHLPSVPCAGLLQG